MRRSGGRPSQPPDASETGRNRAASPRRHAPSHRHPQARTPRTSTTGRRLLLGAASSAAEAISSASATMVECMIRPSASGWPRRSISGAMPATPRATSTMPKRHGRPNESLTMMAGASSAAMPSRSVICSRSCRADASGSGGSSVTKSLRPVFDASMPALAHTNPCFVRLMIRPRSMRRMAADSRSTSSTWRASRSHSRAKATASARGSIVRRSTMQPSALETTFWVTTRMSPARGAYSASAAASARQAAAISAPRSSPGATSGSGGRATAMTSGMSLQKSSTARRRPAAAARPRAAGRAACSSGQALEVVGRIEVEAEQLRRRAPGRWRRRAAAARR